MSNQAILRKADMALSELTSNGGRLSTEQSNLFVRTIIDQPTILRECRQVVMTAPEREINKIGFGSRILKPATEGTGLAVGDRSKPTTSKVTLASKEVIAEVRLPYAVVEDNIQRGNLNFGGEQASGGIVDLLVSMIGERVALDLEELALDGDTASGDAYLALLDGWLKQITTHTVDAGSATLDRSILKAGLKAMPSKYIRDRRALRHYVSVNGELDYADSLAGRETAIGDARHQEAGPNFAAGVRVSPVATLGTSGILTMPQNLIFGIHRDVSFEADKDISARTYIIVVTSRVDFKIEEEDATVKYTNIAN